MSHSPCLCNFSARLVAFDGIPVEVGKWTFESIRKSIQARGRPLTLSFRNDFLTPKQRAILTKAVEDVNAFSPPRPISSHVSRGNIQIVRERNTEYSGDDNEHTITPASSFTSQHSQAKYYSLSEAGSSISSAMAPLMSNLVTGLSSGKQRPEEFTPDYLRRQSDSLNMMRHHQDFKSSLL